MMRNADGRTDEAHHNHQGEEKEKMPIQRKRERKRNGRKTYLRPSVLGWPPGDASLAWSEEEEKERGRFHEPRRGEDVCRTVEARALLSKLRGAKIKFLS